MEEIWKTIKGFESSHLISSNGRVYSILRKKYLIIRHRDKRYSDVSIENNNKRKHFTIHRLVAETFIPNPENKREVNHINGNKSDNNIMNLEWVTTSENMIHSFNNGLRLKLSKKEHKIIAIENWVKSNKLELNDLINIINKLK